MPKLFVPTPNVVEASWEVFGADHVNTCNVAHFHNMEPPTTQLQVDEFVGELSAWFALNIMPYLSHEWRYDTAVMITLDAPDSPKTVDQQYAVSGGFPVKALPNSCAARFDLRTGIVGRSFRGCKYTSGIPENKYTGNRLDATWLELVRSSWELLIPFANGHGWEWVVLSKVTGGVPRTEGIWTPVTDVWAIDDIIDSSRGRMR